MFGRDVDYLQNVISPDLPEFQSKIPHCPDDN